VEVGEGRREEGGGGRRFLQRIIKYTLPGFHLPFAHYDPANVLDLGSLFVLLERGEVELALLFVLLRLVLPLRVPRQLAD